MITGIAAAAAVLILLALASIAAYIGYTIWKAQRIDEPEQPRTNVYGERQPRPTAQRALIIYEAHPPEEREQPPRVMFTADPWTAAELQRLGQLEAHPPIGPAPLWTLHIDPRADYLAALRNIFAAAAAYSPHQNIQLWRDYYRLEAARYRHERTAAVNKLWQEAAHWPIARGRGLLTATAEQAAAAVFEDRDDVKRIIAEADARNSR